MQQTGQKTYRMGFLSPKAAKIFQKLDSTEQNQVRLSLERAYAQAECRLIKQTKPARIRHLRIGYLRVCFINEYDANTVIHIGNHKEFDRFVANYHVETYARDQRVPIGEIMADNSINSQISDSESQSEELQNNPLEAIWGFLKEEIESEAKRQNEITSFDLGNSLKGEVESLHTDTSEQKKAIGINSSLLQILSEKLAAMEAKQNEVPDSLAKLETHATELMAKSESKAKSSLSELEQGMTNKLLELDEAIENLDRTALQSAQSTKENSEQFHQRLASLSDAVEIIRIATEEQDAVLLRLSQESDESRRLAQIQVANLEATTNTLNNSTSEIEQVDKKISGLESKVDSLAEKIQAMADLLEKQNHNLSEQKAFQKSRFWSRLSWLLFGSREK